MKRILPLIIALCAFGSVSAIENDSTSISHKLEISFRGGYVLQSNSLVRGENRLGERINSAVGGAAEYSFYFAPTSRYGRLYPDAYQGLGISYTPFSKSGVTGKPVNFYVLQGMRIARPSTRFSIDYEWNFGISAGWHKNTGESAFSPDEVDGFGSRFNAYIDLGFKFNYALTDRLALTAGVNLSHFSNGNTDYPNPGVNVLWGKVGLIYKPGRIRADIRHDWSGYERHFSYDVTAYGAWAKSNFDSNYRYPDLEEQLHVVPGHFGIAGLNINLLYHFNPMFAIGPSLDFQYDDGANLSAFYVESSPTDDPKFYRQPFKNRIMGGLSARAELQMPIFSINIGIGHSIFAPGGPTLRGWYQMFTLKTFVTNNLYLSTGYRLVRFKNPGNLMLGLGWRFNAR